MGLVKQMLVRLLGGLGTKEEGFTRVGTVAIRYSFICFYVIRAGFLYA